MLRQNRLLLAALCMLLAALCMLLPASRLSADVKNIALGVNEAA